MNHFISVSPSYTYEEYVALMQQLVSEGRTTGTDQNPETAEYTRLNLQRTLRWNKTFVPDESIAANAKNTIKQTWWVITEPWCGDSAQILPQLAAIARISEGIIRLKVILRDEHLPVMDRYLSHGSRSIPKLISVDEKGNELFTWGPRPAAAQKIVLDWKTDPESKSYEDLKKEIHLWYARNNGEELQKELLMLLQSVPHVQQELQKISV